MELTPDELRKMLAHDGYAKYTINAQKGWRGESDIEQVKHRCFRFDVVLDGGRADELTLRVQYMVDGFPRKEITVPMYLMFALPEVIARLERKDKQWENT